MGCMNTTGYISGQLDSYLNNQKYNFQTYFFQQLTLLGFQESQFIVKKTIEISYIPHLKELQTNIFQDVYSKYDSNIYLEPPQTNQLRELYIKVCEFLIKFHDYPVCQLTEQVGHKYRCLLKQNSVFPKNLNLRNFYNQVQRFLFIENQIIIIVNQKDIGHELLQTLKTLKQTKFFLIFQVNQQQNLLQIQQFAEINQLSHLCAIIGLEDKEDRFSVIYNLYQRVVKKSKKSNNDSHSKMLLDYMNSEDSDVLWEEGCLMLNCPYDDSNELDEESKIITISNQIVKSIKPLFQRKLVQSYNEKATSYLKQSIDKSIFKQIKKTMINEIVSALGLNSQSFKKYFSLKLTKITYYEQMNQTIHIRKPVQLKIFHNEIDNKTIQIEQIINKISNHNLNRISTNKFGTLSKMEIQQIIQIIFNSQEISIQYTSLLHIQWSYGDKLLNSELVQNKSQCQYPKYKWKIFNFHTNFKIIGLSLPQAQLKFEILIQFQKSLQNHQYSLFVQQLISSILEMQISIGDAYYPIQNVHLLTFSCQNTNYGQQQNQNQIDVLQEVIFTYIYQNLVIIFLDYKDISHIQLLDELILINKNNQYRIAIINSNSDTDAFELLIDKKNLDMKTENININFWFPSVSTEQLSEYLHNFYKLSLQDNVLIVNKSNQIIWKDHSSNLLETLKMLQTDPIVQKNEKAQSHYGLLKKMKKTLKIAIEKEIKQQGQFSLKNEYSSTNSLSLFEFKWPKQVSYSYNNKSQKIINKKYDKAEYVNELGIPMNMFENIVCFYQKQYY